MPGRFDCTVTCWRSGTQINKITETRLSELVGYVIHLHPRSGKQEHPGDSAMNPGGTHAAALMLLSAVCPLPSSASVDQAPQTRAGREELNDAERQALVRSPGR